MGKEPVFAEIVTPTSGLSPLCFCSRTNLIKEDHGLRTEWNLRIQLRAETSQASGLPALVEGGVGMYMHKLGQGVGNCT